MSVPSSTDLQALSEIEELLRTRPSETSVRESKEENFVWIGRVSAVIARVDAVAAALLMMSIDKVNDPLNDWRAKTGYREIMIALNKARHELRMRTLGPTNIALGQGAVFDYFDEIRKAIESASKDAFFVDPYLDADFVARYFPHVHSGVNVRLLTSKKLQTLLPAVEMYVRQSGLNVAVRSSAGLHDRYLFVDATTCFQSGSSFKDGPKAAPTTLTQITDAFSAMWSTYDRIWNSANIER